MRLSQLTKGGTSVIADISRVPYLLRRRLSDLGVAEGAELILKAAMPFGGPLLIETEGQLISIRKAEADSIEVTAV